jgi:protein translocase SecG subunit
LIYLLYALFILSCIALIASVLLQPGKSDAGALFTSSVSSTAFGPRGTLNILSKITIGSAAVFMLSAFLLSQPALTGNRSVLETTTAPIENPQPLSNENTAVTTEQNTNNAATNANADASNASVAPASNASVTTTTIINAATPAAATSPTANANR